MNKQIIQTLRASIVSLSILSSIVFIFSLLAACSQESSQTESADDLVSSGRLDEAKSLYGDIFEPNAAAAVRVWKERLDAGDDPLNPGCACKFQLPGCGGNVVGRSVDECFPHDGVSLTEKTVPVGCGVHNSKTYNCEQVAGPGATCKLVELTCCGVETTSGYCAPVELSTEKGIDDK